MKPSKIYLEAAKRIDNGTNTYSCCAIQDYQYLYGTKKDLADTYMVETDFDISYVWNISRPRARQLRVLLLCLMSAKAKAEGK